MKSNPSISAFLLRRQWNIVCILIIAAAALVSWSLFYPLGKDVYCDGKKLVQSYKVVSKADSISYMAINMKNNADRLDSLVSTLNDTQTISEQSIPGIIYNLAAKSGIKTSKLEISGQIRIPEGIQIPVTVEVEGTYASCGKFIDGLENMESPVRIRDIDMKGSGRDIVTLFMDFMILSQK
jgi:Tfp pilus assembly protein PilO